MEGSVFDAPVARASSNNCDAGVRSFCSLQPARLTGRKRQWTSDAPDNMSSFVASEMNKLSFAEREKVYEDLHAVSNTSEKTEKEAKVLMTKLRENISTMRRNKKAYNKAVFLNPEYVDSFDFLYIFLVAEKFNPLKAAVKVVDHFSCKLQLFGPHLLSKKITYNDLDEDDKQCLMAGSFQVLGSDRGGRKVILGIPCHQYKVVENQVRPAFAK
jgi:hypothetical protein